MTITSTNSVPGTQITPTTILWTAIIILPFTKDKTKGLNHKKMGTSPANPVTLLQARCLLLHPFLTLSC